MNETFEKYNSVEFWLRHLSNLHLGKVGNFTPTSELLVFANSLRLEYLAHHVVPTIEIVNAHLNLCSTLQQCNTVLPQYEKYGLAYNIKTYNYLILASPSLAIAKNFYSQLISNNIMPLPETYIAILKNCSTLAQAGEVRNLMLNKNMLPTVGWYNSLLKLAPNALEQSKILDEMEQHGVDINLQTVHSVLAKATDFNSAIYIFNVLLHPNFLEPNFHTYCALLKCATTKSEVVIVLNMRKNDNSPDDHTWQQLGETKVNYCRKY